MKIFINYLIFTLILSVMPAQGFATNINHEEFPNLCIDENIKGAFGSGIILNIKKNSQQYTNVEISKVTLYGFHIRTNYLLNTETFEIQKNDQNEILLQNSNSDLKLVLNKNENIWSTEVILNIDKVEQHIKFNCLHGDLGSKIK